MGLDYSIYGMDENGMASSIASDALGAPSPNAHSGAPIDQSAKSKGADDSDAVVHDTDAVLKPCKGADSRARSKGNR